MIEYRIAEEADILMLSNMRWDTWAEGGHDPAVADKEEFVLQCAEFLRQGLQTGQWVCWVAVQDGQILSHIYIQRISKIPKPSKLQDAYGYTTNVYTRPAWRGQGIGAKLLEQVISWGREQDLEFFILWPSDMSLPFYDRAGFRPTEALELELRPYVN